MLTNELYEIQAGLKANIDYRQHDKFSRMMLAMLVEFSECANDWQLFKYWKKHNEPKETVLEEYVDGLHFVLEAGIDLKEMGLIRALPQRVAFSTYGLGRSITSQFKKVMSAALQLDSEVEFTGSRVEVRYLELFENYLLLGQMLGFAEDEVIAAYLEKNKVNHERQNTGY